MRAHLELQAEQEMRDNLRSGSPTSGPPTDSAGGCGSQGLAQAQGPLCVQRAAFWCRRRCGGGSLRRPVSFIRGGLSEGRGCGFPFCSLFLLPPLQSPGSPELRLMVGVSK